MISKTNSAPLLCFMLWFCSLISFFLQSFAHLIYFQIRFQCKCLFTSFHEQSKHLFGIFYKLYKQIQKTILWKYVNCFGFFVVVVVVLKSNASLLTSKVCPVFNFMTYKSVLNCEKNAIGPSIIETSFIAIRRIWIFVGNIAAFCLDIIQK